MILLKCLKPTAQDYHLDAQFDNRQSLVRVSTVDGRLAVQCQVLALSKVSSHDAPPI